MASQQVTVVVRLEAKAGKEAQVRQEWFNLLAPTRASEGVAYDFPGQPTTSAWNVLT